MSWFHTSTGWIAYLFYGLSKKGRKILKMNNGNRSNMNNETMHAYICWKWMSSSPIELLSLKGICMMVCYWIDMSMSIEWFWMPIMDMIWLWTWIELKYMKNAPIAKERGAIYSMCFKLMCCTYEYHLFHHSYFEKFCHHKKWGDCWLNASILKITKYCVSG